MREKLNLKSHNEVTTSVKGIQDISIIPVVKNIAPNVATVGQEYRFDLGIMDSDTIYQNLSASIVHGPTWLRVEGLSVIGIPPFYSVGDSKIIVKVSDGTNYSLYTFYLTVTESNENL